MKIEMKNIIIRDYMEKDLYDIYELYSDKITTKFMENDRVKTIEEARALLKKKVVSNGEYALTLKDDTLVGEVMFINVKKGVYEISPIIRSSYMRKGYASEACLKLIDLYTEKLGAYSFVAYADKENEGFISFLESLGFYNSGTISSKLVYEL